jgi:phytoene dehydrogenase-like protein
MSSDRPEASHRRYDAVVIGSGPNGLSAAITLARAGKSVLVLEARDTVGGGMRTAELTLPGFRHDVCSAVHPLALASPFFRSIPLAEHGLEFIHPKAPLAHPLSNDNVMMLERRIDATAAPMGFDAVEYRDLLRPFVEQADDLFADILAPLHWPRRPLLMARFGLRAIRSAYGLATKLFRNEPTRALFAGNAAHSVLPLEHSLTSGVGLMLHIAAHAVGWPIARGGSQSIANALASHLRELGGEIITGRTVASLGELPEARAYLFDTSPQAMAQIAGDQLPEKFARRLQRYRFGPGAYKIDWALSQPIPWASPDCARAGTVHIGGSLEQIAMSERAAWSGKASEQPFVLLAQPSLFDPSRAPAGQHTAWAYCHVPNGCTTDMTAIIEAQVERYARGFRDTILARHTMSPQQFEQYNANCIGGDITGGVQDLWQLFTRPSLRIVPYATPNPRLYICSASTPPGGGVHGMCGFWAARAALARAFQQPPAA